MTADRVRLLAADTLRALLSRRANVILVVILLGLLTVASCSLQVTGETMVNGRSIPIGADDRLQYAVGVTFGGVHFFGALLVLFLIVPAVTGELESGMASWILVKPIRRATYLFGRLAGAFLFLAAFTAAAVIGLEILLARYAGGFDLAPFLGGGVLIILLAAYLVWGVFFALQMGAGPAGIAVVLLALSGAIVDFDPLTRVLLKGASDSAGGGLLDAVFAAFAPGEGPHPAARIVYAVLYALLPGTGNVHDLTVTLATHRSLAIATDALSFAVVVAGIPVALLGCRRALERREL